MDHLLKKFGFLEFSASNVVFGPMQWGPVRKVARKAYDFLGLHGKVSLPQSVNWSKTKAFTTIRSTGEGVSINLAGREPDGIVDPADFEKVRDQVMDALSSFVDPKTGRKPVKAIYRREEIFKGKHADTAPDILMEPAEQYSLTHAKSALEDADWISGDHRIEGVIVAAGPNVKAFEQPPMLVDMAPTILAALDAPASIEHTGRVLHEVVGSDAKVSQAEPSKPAVQIPGMPTGSEELERQRHRGRRDGGAPPRSRVPRVVDARIARTMELFDYSLWGAPLALLIGVVALVWRRWLLPLIFGSAECRRRQVHVGMVRGPASRVRVRFRVRGVRLGDRVRVGGRTGRRAAGSVAVGSQIAELRTARRRVERDRHGGRRE